MFAPTTSRRRVVALAGQWLLGLAIPFSLLACEDTRGELPPLEANCAATEPYEALQILYNFEDQTTGGFYTYHDNSEAGVQLAPSAAGASSAIEGGGRCGSQYALRFAGSRFVLWGEGMGVLLASDFRAWGGYPGPDSGPIPVPLPVPRDVSSCKGLSFWARSPAPGSIETGGGSVTFISFRLSDSQTSNVPIAVRDQLAEAGVTGAQSSLVAGPDHCIPAPPIVVDAGPVPFAVPLPQRCDDFGAYLAIARPWTFYTIPFSSMTQNGGGKVFAHIDPSALYTLTFTPFPKGEPFDLWFDDIGFYGCPIPDAGPDSNDGPTSTASDAAREADVGAADRAASSEGAAQSDMSMGADAPPDVSMSGDSTVDVAATDASAD